MSEVKRQTRRDRARQTRARIVAAAHTEFCANGYQGTTMAAVAKRAQVAVQTVYFVFHTKIELLTEVHDTAVLGDPDGTPPERTDWFLAASADPDPAKALHAFVTGTGHILARVAPLHPVINAAAQTDPEVATAQAHREQLRVQGYSSLITALHDRKALRPNLTVDTATDILLTMVGPAVYTSLVTARGWTHEHYVSWTADTLAQVLLRR